MAQLQSERIHLRLTVEQQASAQKAITDACEPNGYFCRLFSAANLPTMLLVLIGAGGILAAIKTLNAIEKQADAMINSERAWLLVDLERVPGVGVHETTGLNKSGIQTVQTTVYVRCVCSNHGRTAARVIEKRCCLIQTDSDDPLPQTPNLDIDITDPIPHYLGTENPVTRDWAITGDALEFPGQMVVIYGVVKYKHLFSQEEVHTTFGYKLTADHKLERLTEDYRKYNENT